MKVYIKNWLLLSLSVVFPIIAIANGNKLTTTALYSNKEGQSIIATEEPSSFAGQITANIPQKDRKQVLENYVNSLLKANAVYSTIDNNKDIIQAPTLIYQIQANREGKIIATRSEQGKYGIQIGNRSLPVYGINYQLESGCSWQEQLCWVLYPSTNNQKERWLEISYAPRALSELTEGVSLLIRSLQK